MTSIEWLFEQIEGEGDIQRDVLSNVLEIKISVSNFLEIKRIAKEMHKQEILDAFVECWKENMPEGYVCKQSAEYYYSITDGSKGSGMSEIPNNLIEAVLSLTEISDEEIEKAAADYDNGVLYGPPLLHFEQGAFWYREQLKQKQ